MSASASLACEAGCLAGPEEDTVSDPDKHKKNDLHYYKLTIMINLQRKKRFGYLADFICHDVGVWGSQ